MNGGGGPPPLIAPSDSQVSVSQIWTLFFLKKGLTLSVCWLYFLLQSLLYAQYAAAEYPNYTGLVSPLLAAEYTTDPTGGLFAR